MSIIKAALRKIVCDMCGMEKEFEDFYYLYDEGWAKIEIFKNDRNKGSAIFDTCAGCMMVVINRDNLNSSLYSNKDDVLKKLEEIKN